MHSATILRSVVRLCVPLAVALALAACATRSAAPVEERRTPTARPTTPPAAASAAAPSAALFYPSTYMKIFVNGVWVEDDVGIPAAIHDSTVPFTFGSHNEGSFFDGLMTMNILVALLANETTQETVIKSLYQHTRALFGVRS